MAFRGARPTQLRNVRGTRGDKILDEGDHVVGVLAQKAHSHGAGQDDRAGGTTSGLCGLRLRPGQLLRQPGMFVVFVEATGAKDTLASCRPTASSRSRSLGKRSRATFTCAESRRTTSHPWASRSSCRSARRPARAPCRAARFWSSAAVTSTAPTRPSGYSIFEVVHAGNRLVIVLDHGHLQLSSDDGHGRRFPARELWRHSASVAGRCSRSASRKRNPLRQHPDGSILSGFSSRRRSRCGVTGRCRSAANR